MWKLVKDNRGSIALEISLVMPVVIGVVMMLIFLIVKGVNEGATLSASQVIVYEYGDLYDNNHVEYDFEELSAVVILDSVEGNIDVGDKYVRVIVSGENDIDKYSVEPAVCKREWKLCTERLRRWQLYGDVLCE